MQVRRATMGDWPQIADFVNSRDYFMPVDPETLGGEWFIAVDTAGHVRGTIWFFAAGPNAYVDYWAATSPRVAGYLASVLDATCKVLGIRYVRAMIATNNTNARRMATKGFGMVESGSDYKLVFRSI